MLSDNYKLRFRTDDNWKLSISRRRVTGHLDLKLAASLVARERRAGQLPPARRSPLLLADRFALVSGCF